METKDNVIEVLDKTFNNIINQIDVDKKQSSLMKNEKHIELVERYAKVLSQHYIGKFANHCTNMLAIDLSNVDLTKKAFAKFETKMEDVSNVFSKDMDATLKSVKKYFGHAYSNECLTNVTKECFLNDFKGEKEEFLNWIDKIDMSSRFEHNMSKSR